MEGSNLGQKSDDAAFQRCASAIGNVLRATCGLPKSEPIMPLSQLIYHSINRLEPGKASLFQLADILKASNRNNQRLGITGALLFDDDCFIQVLEGDRVHVMTIFERLKSDDRHCDVTLEHRTEKCAAVFGPIRCDFKRLKSTRSIPYEGPPLSLTSAT